MADLQSRLKSVVEELDKRIEDKDTLEFVKTQIYNLSLIFLDEIDRITELNNKKMEELAEKYREINDKVENIEDSVKNIENDLYMQDGDDEDEFGLEILCPYCNNEFLADFSDELKDEVICPECNNIIELDWNKDESNDDNNNGCRNCGGTSGCPGCGNHNDEENK